MTAPVDRHEFWRRTLRAWDLGFAALLAVVAVPLAADAPGDPGAAAALVALTVLAAAYVLVGRRAALAGDGRGADAYLVVLLAVVSLATWAGDVGFTLLFVAYSQIWFFARRRLTGIAWCVALTAAVTASVGLRLAQSGRGWSASVAEVGGQMLVSLAFSIVVGLWITAIAEQSEERAELIDRLEQAQAALAVEHHAAGVLAERSRVAQEIHDTLAQGFTSVVMLSQAAGAELDRGRDDEVRRRLVQVESVARENLAEARALVAAFGPADLQTGSLADALRRLAARVADETGVRVLVEAAPAPADAPAVPLGREVEVALLRTAQEALANVRRHAGASTVRVHLAVGPDGAALEVTDDGRGLRPGAREGVGLRGMRSRAEATGGTLTLEAPEGGGTRVRLRLPVVGPVAPVGPVGPVGPVAPVGPEPEGRP
ncbi:sensor histidine kinase [Cellulomonas endophytica]|uniref:sensor histidine kinase n=1 Tax=Cellulomonas endophytica TaxID=2494735 RepID=UPI0010135872|nr:sensor histidine kinase [Cellulomonas endophytica]